MHDESSHLLPCAVKAEVAFIVRNFKNFLFDCVGDAQPVLAFRLDGILFTLI